MAISETAIGILAVVLAYLLGSIPSARLLPRLINNAERHRIGRGVGALNVYRQLGMVSGITVMIADMAKGAAAVGAAYWLLGVSQIFSLLAGLAAVAGHLWMVFLKFHGGGGIATCLGVLITLLPVYGYWPELLFFLAIIAVVVVITRNVVAAIAVAQFFLPFIIWFCTHSLPVTIFSIALDVIMGLKRLPSLRGDWNREGGLKNFIFHNSFRRTRR